MSSFEIVSLSDLKEHEETERERLDTLKSEIQARGAILLPVVADKETGMILDGHHRTASLRELGCARVPVVWVDYLSPRIVVRSWKDGSEINKEDVAAALLRGEKLPPKTTRHFFLTDGGELVHVSAALNPIEVSLEQLR